MFWSIPLFAASVTSAFAAISSGQTTIYPLESGIRGTQIVNTFKSVTVATGINYPQFALQTSVPGYSYASYKYISNGYVPYVQSITGTTYNTLLIVGYQPNTATSTLYLVVPPEQVTTMLYFPNIYNQPSSTAPFSSTFANGTLSYFSVDMAHRAADIVFAVNYLLTTTLPYKTSQSQVWIQTTLNGPYNPFLNNSNTPGLIQNVTSISVTNNLLKILYLPNNITTLTQVIYVEPEQVQQIILVYNRNNPSSLL